MQILIIADVIIPNYNRRKWLSLSISVLISIVFRKIYDNIKHEKSLLSIFRRFTCNLLIIFGLRKRAVIMNHRIEWLKAHVLTFYKYNLFTRLKEQNIPAHTFIYVKYSELATKLILLVSYNAWLCAQNHLAII